MSGYEDQVNIQDEATVEVNQSEQPEEVKRPTNAVIKTNFSLPATTVYFIVNATGQKSETVAAKSKIQLMQGRTYYIPIDHTEIDTDQYEHIKVFSNMADKIDVRYVKEGYACVVPLMHHIQILHETPLCVVW